MDDDSRSFVSSPLTTKEQISKFLHSAPTRAQRALYNSEGLKRERKAAQDRRLQAVKAAKSGKVEDKGFDFSEGRTSEQTRNLVRASESSFSAVKAHLNREGDAAKQAVFEITQGVDAELALKDQEQLHSLLEPVLALSGSFLAPATYYNLYERVSYLLDVKNKDKSAHLKPSIANWSRGENRRVLQRSSVRELQDHLEHIQILLEYCSIGEVIKKSIAKGDTKIRNTHSRRVVEASIAFLGADSWEEFSKDPSKFNSKKSRLHREAFRELLIERALLGVEDNNSVHSEDSLSGGEETHRSTVRAQNRLGEQRNRYKVQSRSEIRAENSKDLFSNIRVSQKFKEHAEQLAASERQIAEEEEEDLKIAQQLEQLKDIATDEEVEREEEEAAELRMAESSMYDGAHWDAPWDGAEQQYPVQQVQQQQPQQRQQPMFEQHPGPDYGGYQGQSLVAGGPLISGPPSRSPYPGGRGAIQTHSGMQRARQHGGQPQYSGAPVNLRLLQPPAVPSNSRPQRQLQAPDPRSKILGLPFGQKIKPAVVPKPPPGRGSDGQRPPDPPQPKSGLDHPDFDKEANLRNIRAYYKNYTQGELDAADQKVLQEIISTIGTVDQACSLGTVTKEVAERFLEIIKSAPLLTSDPGGQKANEDMMQLLSDASDLCEINHVATGDVPFYVKSTKVSTATNAMKLGGMAGNDSWGATEGSMINANKMTSAERIKGVRDFLTMSDEWKNETFMDGPEPCKNFKSKDPKYTGHGKVDNSGMRLVSGLCEAGAGTPEMILWFDAQDKGSKKDDGVESRVNSTHFPHQLGAAIIFQGWTEEFIASAALGGSCTTRNMRAAFALECRNEADIMEFFSVVSSKGQNVDPREVCGARPTRNKIRACIIMAAAAHRIPLKVSSIWDIGQMNNFEDGLAALSRFRTAVVNANAVFQIGQSAKALCNTLLPMFNLGLGGGLNTKEWTQPTVPIGPFIMRTENGVCSRLPDQYGRRNFITDNALAYPEFEWIECGIQDWENAGIYGEGVEAGKYRWDQALYDNLDDDDESRNDPGGAAEDTEARIADQVEWATGIRFLSVHPNHVDNGQGPPPPDPNKDKPKTKKQREKEEAERKRKVAETAAKRAKEMAEENAALKRAAKEAEAKSKAANAELVKKHAEEMEKRNAEDQERRDAVVQEEKRKAEEKAEADRLAAEAD